MQFNIDRVRENVRGATTEDLLDRATVYQMALEPQALPVILEELKTRGLSAEDIVAHEASRREVLFDANGIARTCNACAKPAVVQEWGWHQLFGKLPVFPRLFWRCEDHRRPPPPPQTP
jgi:hypothetical protein